MLRPDAPEAQDDALLLARLITHTVSRCARFLERIGGWQGLLRVTTKELQRRHGLALAQAERLTMAFEIGRRLPFPQSLPCSVRTSVDVAELLLSPDTVEQETCFVVSLTTQHAVIAVETLYVGTIDRIVIRPAEVFRSAIRRNAATVVLAHTQPSGDLEPSLEDIAVTRALLATGRLLELPLLDHLIMGNGRWLSLREWQPSLWGTTSTT